MCERGWNDSTTLHAVGKNSLMFFTRFLMVFLLVGIGAAQAKAAPGDLAGAGTSDQGKRTRGTAWPNSGLSVSISMVAIMLANMGGVFSLDTLPWLTKQQ